MHAAGCLQRLNTACKCSIDPSTQTAAFGLSQEGSNSRAFGAAVGVPSLLQQRGQEQKTTHALLDCCRWEWLMMISSSSAGRRLLRFFVQAMRSWFLAPPPFFILCPPPSSSSSPPPPPHHHRRRQLVAVFSARRLVVAAAAGGSENEREGHPPECSYLIISERRCRIR